MRTVVFAAIVMIGGCTMPPADTSDIEPLIAVTGYYSILAAEADKAAPKPLSDVCESCHGSGVVGDVSQVRMTCTDCGGTGKKKKSVLVAPPAPPASTIRVSPTCTSGTCTTRTIVR
jgi:RecJ-like exonuclease